MQKIKILLIEDEKIIAKNMQEILEKLGYEVVAVDNTAEDAFESIFDNSIDLVISDIEIRGLLDGIDASKIFQDIYNIPIIFITAYNDKDKIERASFIENMAGYLVKPINVNELNELIKLAIIKYDLLNRKKIIEINEYYNYNTINKIVYEGENEISLTKNEGLLLSLLINNQDKIISYEVINFSIWNDYEISDITRRQLIHRLKTKLNKLQITSKKGQGIYIKK